MGCSGDTTAGTTEGIRTLASCLSGGLYWESKLRREENTESNMPQVLDYVQQKAEAYELERSLNAWKRKVDIAEMEAKHVTAREGAMDGRWR